MSDCARAVEVVHRPARDARRRQRALQARGSGVGGLGHLFERYNFPIAPLVLGTILGPLAETNFMTTMVSFDNDWTVFFTRPISGVILVLSILGLAWPLAKAFAAKLLGTTTVAPAGPPAS